MAQLSLDHQFNGDLLISKHDQELAKKIYGEIYHVLDHPELRKEFQKYDDIANSSKFWVQRLGLSAVILAGFALLGSAVAPLVYQSDHVPRLLHGILFVLEVGGIIGVVISAVGVSIARQKNRWLKSRMMAEVLRLWHFQTLICRGKEIAMSCDSANSDGPANYREFRTTAFQVMLNDWGGVPDSHLTKLIENPAATRHRPASSSIVSLTRK